MSPITAAPGAEPAGRDLPMPSDRPTPGQSGGLSRLEGVRRYRRSNTDRKQLAPSPPAQKHTELGYGRYVRNVTRGKVSHVRGTRHVRDTRVLADVITG